MRKDSLRSERGFLRSLDKLVGSFPHIVACLLQTHHDFGGRISLHLVKFISPDAVVIVYIKGQPETAKKRTWQAKTSWIVDLETCLTHRPSLKVFKRNFHLYYGVGSLAQGADDRGNKIRCRN